MVQDPPDQFLSVREVAERLGVCTATVYKLCSRGRLGHVRVLNVVRISVADLVAFTARARGFYPASARGPADSPGRDP